MCRSVLVLKAWAHLEIFSAESVGGALSRKEA